MGSDPLNGSIRPRKRLIREVASIDGQEDSTGGGISTPLAISASAGAAAITAEVGPLLHATVINAVAAKRLSQMDTTCMFRII